MNKRKNRMIVCLCLLVFMLSISSLFTPYNNQNTSINNESLETNDINTLFNGVSYPFEIRDVYDDENYTKIYTDAYLQTEHNQNGTIFNDTVSVVDNTEHTHPDGTQYYGTHDFREYADGTEGYDITGFTDYYSADADTSGKIISEMDDHKKVLELEDRSNVGSVKIRHNFDYTEVDSTIEFWLASNTTASGYRGLYVYFYDQNLVNTMVLVITNTVLQYYNGTSDYTIYTITANEFFHVKMVLDDTADTYDVYVDDVLKETDINYINPSTSNAYRIYFATRTGNAGYKINVDAIGYSGDPDYNVGDNFYPDFITITEGTYDSTDNMDSLDASYSDFETDSYFPELGDPEYINSITYDSGAYYSGAIANTQTNDSNYYCGGNNKDVRMNIFFDPVVGGRDFKISLYIIKTGSPPVGLFKINGITVASGTTIDLDGVLYEDVNTIEIEAAIYFNMIVFFYIYYFKIEEVLPTTPSDGILNFTVENTFANYDDDGLLSLGITSHHQTNISTPITASIWNYDSSTYETLFTSSSTSIQKNHENLTSNLADYFSSGNVKIRYNGSYTPSDFILNVDYLEFRITYKMDIIIYKTFYENGLWCYRFELIGSLQYTDWTYFEVVDPEPNFHAISESDYTTRWILQNSTLSPVEDFHDDLTLQNWRLNDTPESSFSIYTSSLSDYLFDDYSTIESTWHYSGTSISTGSYDPCVRYYGGYFWVLGSDEFIYKYNTNWTYTGSSWNITVNGENQMKSITYNGTNWYAVGWLNDRIYEYYDNWTYTGNSWASYDGYTMSIIFHNGYFWLVGNVNDIVYKFNSDWSYTGTSYYVGSQDDYPNGIFYSDGNWYMLGNQYDRVYKYDDSWTYTGSYYSISSQDIYPLSIFYYNNWWLVGQQHWSIYQYDNIEDVEKFYHNDFMYFQTNKTESIGIKSFDYGTHKTLVSGDYFEVDFQTSSDSLINLILLKDGVVQKTLTLSQSGNTNFNRHTVQISVSEGLEFDQLKISSTFEDQDYIKVYDIKTYKYTLTGDFADFYIGSHSTKSVYLTPSIYNLRVFEGGTKKIDTNVTITSSDYWYIYQPTPTFLCRLTLHSVEGINLDLTNFHILVNRSSGGSYSQFSLLGNTFNVDEGTNIYFEISDRFDNLIDDFQQVASDYIDLELEVYSLKVKNLMEQQTTVDINTTQTFPVLSGELIEYILSKNYYEIGYYDMDNDYHQFVIYLNSNQAFELNRSKICFLSYADQQGNHLYFDNYKTYINGSMIYEQIFYEDAGDDVNITITDRYDYQVHSEIYSVDSGDNFIPITLTMYSLKVMNQQEVFNHINITRDPNNSEYFWSEWIAPGERIEFKLFAGDYIINLTDTENGWSSYGYELNGDDTLLFTSDNIISNVLINIANTNTTIGNLITYVQIDLTNQNTEINNSIISIVINIESINSTLGDLLIDIQTEITNIESSIISEIVDMGVQITNVNSSLSEQILTITTDISNLDSSITSQFLTLGVAIENINGSIIDQILLIGVNITNVQTVITDQILSLEIDISNYNSSIVDQILLVIADIENIETVIDDQTLVILSDITNVNSTLLNQMVVLGVNITNINATITNQILSLSVDLTNINSTITTMLTDIGVSITTMDSFIGTFFTFTNNSFINLNTNMNNSFIYIENNIISINQTISTLVIGIDNRITVLNGTITMMFTEMSQQFIITQSTLDYSFTFLNQTLIQLANDIEDNQIVLYNLIEQRANDIDSNLIDIQTLINLVNNTVADESLVIQTLVNIIGANITENHIIINTLLNLIDNNITNNNIQLTSILELIGNNITTNQFILETLINVIGNNITENHIELLTNLNLINTTIGTNQIELINRILFINSTISDLIFELTNQIFFINDTIYTAVLDVSTSLEFGVNCVLGNISLTYEQNEFLTDLYKETMFSQLLNWSGVAYNYSVIEDQIDVWDFVNNYNNQSIIVLLRYGDLIDNLTISAQNTIDQYLPESGVEYREWSEELQDYIGEWTPLPENRTVNFGFFETDVPIVPKPIEADVIMLLSGVVIIAVVVVVIAIAYGRSKKEVYETPEKVRNMYKDKNKGKKRETFDQSGF